MSVASYTQAFRVPRFRLIADVACVTALGPDASLVTFVFCKLLRTLRPRDVVFTPIESAGHITVRKAAQRIGEVSSSSTGTSSRRVGERAQS